MNKKPVGKFKDVFKEQRRITVKEFLDEMDALYNLKGRLSRRKRHWVHLIKTNQLQCVATKKLVSYCSYDKNEKAGTFHYNFYSEDGELFTIDHIIPISRGGSKGSLDNVQPMIAETNFEKSNQMLYINK